MRKLSEAQVNALTSIHTTGYAPAAKRLTLESLVTRGSMFFADSGYVLTTQGRTEIGADVLPPADPAVTMIDEITEVNAADVVVSVPKDGAGYDVRKPVALDREGRLNIRHWLRPAAEVQELRDILLTPVNGHAMTEAQVDAILDTWHVVANRTDRRAEAKADKRQGRRRMRATRTPSRRRFTSETALIRKAERRALKTLAA